VPQIPKRAVQDSQGFTGSSCACHASLDPHSPRRSPRTTRLDTLLASAFMALSLSATRFPRHAGLGGSRVAMGVGVTAGVHSGAAEGAPRRALEPRQRASPVESVPAGEVREDIAGAELVEAHRALGLLRRVPPRPAPPNQPPHHALLRVHLTLHRRRGRRRRAPLAAAPAGSDAPGAVVPATRDQVFLS
jgi:hypothetical protein